MRHDGSGCTARTPPTAWRSSGDTAIGPQTGVCIPRRNNESWADLVLGGPHLFREHRRSRFRVDETDQDVAAYTYLDGAAWVDVSAHITDALGDSRPSEALRRPRPSSRPAQIGYSAHASPNQVDELGLKTSVWKIESTSVAHVQLCSTTPGSSRPDLRTRRRPGHAKAASAVGATLEPAAPGRARRMNSRSAATRAVVPMSARFIGANRLRPGPRSGCSTGWPGEPASALRGRWAGTSEDRRAPRVRR
jgi:hypothetical protein